MSAHIRDLESADSVRSEQLHHLREENALIKEDLQRALECHALSQRRAQATEECAAALEERLAAAEAHRARSRVLEHTEEVERLLERALADASAARREASEAVRPSLKSPDARVSIPLPALSRSPG